MEKTKQTNTKMEAVCSLWKNESVDEKTGKKKTWFSGKGLVGFYNTFKKNPKEPDLKVYYKKGHELGELHLSMWVHTSKAGKKFLSGKLDNNKKVIAFINENTEGNKPYLNVYYSNDHEAKVKEDEGVKKELAKQPAIYEPLQLEEDDLPF